MRAHEMYLLTPFLFQSMYAIEMKHVPMFRTHIEDMNYFAVPSRFPLHTSYVEVICRSILYSFTDGIDYVLLLKKLVSGLGIVL